MAGGNYGHYVLGPVSSVASGARRRARRRRRIALVSTILIVFIGAELIHQIVNAGHPAAHRNVASWLAYVAPTLTDANTLSATLDSLESKGPSMNRVQLTLIANSLVSASQAQADNVQSSSFAPPSSRVEHLLLDALESRTYAFGELQTGINAAISTGLSTEAERLFTRAATQMRSAQSSYVQFLNALPKGSDRSVLPKVRWMIPTSLWSTPRLANFATQLGAAGQLRAHHQLTIAAISITPLPEIIPTTTTSTSTTTSTTTTTIAAGSPTTTVPRTTKRSSSQSTTTTTTIPQISQIPEGSTPSVFAPTTQVQPIVVVKNEGNVVESNVVVYARMNGQTVRSAPIGALLPGRSVYLKLGSLVVVTKTMSPCSQSTLRHDRCTSITVRLGVGSHTVASRSVALAFFVS